jgi:xanthine dehydrogenase molybdopterin-binding subunit B
MRMKWRLGLVAILAAVVVGGFVPHGAASGSEGAASEMVQIAESPLSMPLSCMDTTCGKGSPTPTAPVPAAALAAVLSGFALAAAARTLIRRRRAQMAVLPAGSRDPLFHPPQFS